MLLALTIWLHCSTTFGSANSRYSMLFRVILHTLEGGTRLVRLPKATKGKASCPLFETRIMHTNT